MKTLMLATVLALASCELAPCDANAADHLKVGMVVVPRIVPNAKLCVYFEAAPDVQLRQGARVRVEVPKALEPGVEYELCHAAGVTCPTRPGTNVSGTICDSVPLSAMLLAGQSVPFTMHVDDESGAPLACMRGEGAVVDTIAVDADVEAMADEAVHNPLRRALHAHAITIGARGGEAAEAASDESTVSGVLRLLRKAYEASPEWADAFSRWQHQHGRRQQQQGQREEVHAILAEAQSFAQFRENVLSAHRLGRALSVDERLDMKPDARRTLGHFA